MTLHANSKKEIYFRLHNISNLMLIIGRRKLKTFSNQLQLTSSDSESCYVIGI